MVPHRLLIVVDCAVELNSYWPVILRDLLADIVRDLHRDGSTSQDPRPPRPSLGLIVYGSEGPCTRPQVQPWGWTNDLNTFLQWLSAVPFTSGEFSEAALANGISTALEVIAAARDSNEAQVFGQSHCILVTSYKFLPSTKPGPKDQTFDNQMNLRKMDRFLFDSAAVARNFVQSSVSLSIISPKKSFRLKEVFEAGNAYKSRVCCFTVSLENIDYLILLSDNFVEAHAALSHRNFTELLPANMPDSSLKKILADIEKCLFGNSDNDGDVKGLPENIRGSTSNRRDFKNNTMRTGGTAMALARLPRSSLLVNPRAGCKTPPPYASVAPAHRGPDNYVKAWEGDITTLVNGETLAINRLVAYRKDSTSVMLFSNWPDRVHMEQLLSKIQVDAMQFVCEVEYICIEGMCHNSILDQIVGEVLCAYIRLPQQTLILYPSGETSRFVGRLYSGVLDIPNSNGVRSQAVNLSYELLKQK